MKASDPSIVVEASYPVPVSEVWSALTDVSEMRQWFFDNIPDFKPEVGFKTSFAVQSENRIFTHLWEVTEVIPQQKITYNWKYEEYPGDGFVTFDLMTTEEGTHLKLTNIVTKDYPQDIPEFQRESCLGGWNYFLGQSLKEYLGKK